MNILIVNAFGESPIGKTKFNSFLSLIKKIFKKVSEHSGIDNFNYIIRNPSTLADYTFNYYSNPSDETVELQNRKNFSSLDMVFIDGCESYSPWKSRSHNLSKLVRLCKLTNKVLYAGGVALEILIFYLATGSVNEYHIINSNGEVKSLEEINIIPFEFLNGLRKNEIFLDFVNGDLLEYRSIDKAWEPIMNIGLHHQISAEKYYSRGKFVLTDSFRGKDYTKNEFAMKTLCHEIKVRITRQYISHYLVENCPIEFMAICTLEWYPHYVNVTAKKLQFKTICQSERGPIVLEHENTIGVAFHAQERCMDSVKILKNFINKKFNEVKDKLLKNKNIKISIKNPNKEISPIFKIFKANDDRLKGKFDPDEEIPINPYCLVGKVNHSSLFNRTKKVKHEAKHVGQSINNREMIFVENNYINQRTHYSLKSNKKEKNSSMKNNKNIFRKHILSFGKLRSDSLISNSFKTNKTLNTINSVTKRNHPFQLNKKLINRGTRTEKRKDIKNLNLQNINTQNKNKFDDNIYLKIKSLTEQNTSKNNIIENDKNYNNDEENYKLILLDKLINPKPVDNNENKKDLDREKEKKEEKEEEFEDFQDYQSKYPRLPTLNELSYLLNNPANNLRTKSFDFDNINLDLKNKLNSKSVFLRKKSEYSQKRDIKYNSGKYILKTNANNFDERKDNFNSKTNLNENYKPIINKKYHFDNRFEKF